MTLLPLSSGPRYWELAKRWLLPAAGGAFLGTCYPPFRTGEAAWIALIPLLFAVEGCARGEAFRRGYVAGLVFFGMTVWWTIHVTLPGMVALIAVLALYFGLGALWFNELLRRMVAGRDAAWRNFVTIAAGAAGWVTLEWIRGHFPFGGFGWNGLGVSQAHAVPLIQLAALTGVYGVSALVAMVNLALFFTVRRLIGQIRAGAASRRLSWEFYLTMGIVCAAFLAGLRQVRRSSESRQLRLALIQANIPQTLKFDPAHREMILDRYRRLTEQAAVMCPDLIIWPESATPDALRYDRDSYELVTNMAVTARAHLLTGTFDITPGSQPAESFNAAALVRPDGSLAEIYRKNHLVVFGEYVPLRKVFPFIKYLTPIGDSFERGREQTIFEMTVPPRPVTLRSVDAGTNQTGVLRFDQDARQDGTYRFGAVICFEDTVADLYRKFVAQGVDFMVNLTNDAWFKESPAAQMHLVNAVFRAVESRRPLVRGTNNGVTGIVDEFGNVNPRLRLTPFREEMIVCELSVPARGTVTPYVRYGDWFVSLCALLCAIITGTWAWQCRPRQQAAV